MITFFAVFGLIVSISSVTIKYEFTSCKSFDQIIIDNKNSTVFFKDKELKIDYSKYDLVITNPPYN